VGSGTLLVEQGRGAVASVTETLESMATLVQDLSGQLAAIATATEQQSRAAQEVAGTVERLPGSAISPASMASRGADRRPPDPGDRETDIGHQPLRTGCLTQVRENGADLWVCPVFGPKPGGGRMHVAGAVLTVRKQGDGVLCTALWLFLPAGGHSRRRKAWFSKLLQVSWLSRLTSRMARFRHPAPDRWLQTRRGGRIR
jgi:hypothetical protein